MTQPATIRPIHPDDLNDWLPLFDGYNAFYSREGPTALASSIKQTTWERFFDPNEPVFALVAERDGKLVGLVHYLWHRSTTRTEPVCYLQDLFTDATQRGSGVGRALILRVYEEAAKAVVKRVYWQTHETNAAGRLLYDKVAKHMGAIVYSHDL